MLPVSMTSKEASTTGREAPMRRVIGDESREARGVPVRYSVVGHSNNPRFIPNEKTPKKVSNRAEA